MTLIEAINNFGLCPKCGGPGDFLVFTAGTVCRPCADDGHALATGRITRKEYDRRAARRKVTT